MKFRRAPRAARRGRKFKARPTSHDGFDVIAAYGNRPGFDQHGRTTGRFGRNIIVCQDGYRLSVIAGYSTHTLPRLADRFADELQFGEVTPDYRGPYSHVEIRAESPPRLDVDIPDTDPRGPVHIAAVRALIRLHGGAARMQPVANHRTARATAIELVLILASVHLGNPVRP